MALCFTSCINIIEKLKLNKNGSGTYAMTIDMGRLAGMMKMMGQDGEGMDELMHSGDSSFQANRSWPFYKSAFLIRWEWTTPDTT